MALKVPSPSTIIIAILFAVCGSSFALSDNCSSTRQLTKSIFGNSFEVHNKSFTDKSLKICSPNSTCCSKNLEMKLRMMSEKIRVQMVSHLQGHIKDVFANISRNFTEFFKELIENSYQNLDTLYSRTYLDRYTNHKEIFRDLFTKLGGYMSGKEDIDLKQTVESWFSLLYQKVYMIAHPSNSFDATYQHCILETADTLMPFGDLPRKISVQIRKSFLASKVLQDALVVGKQAIEDLLKMKANENCSRAFTKMTHCSICSGIKQNVKPCYKYCMNVIKGCSAYPAVVNPSWNAYVTALQKLAIKVSNPFSMEAVIDPLGVKISDGIMKFQRNTPKISAHVVSKCGQPPQTKPVKRRSLADDLSYPYKFDSTSNVRPNTAYGTNLHSLILQLKTILSEVKDHWISLPRIVCASGMAAPEGSSGECWNGENVNGYSKPVVKDGIEDMFKNPEVALNKNQPHLTVPRQIIKLKEITQRIEMAVNGYDSIHIDIQGTSGDGSGSGTNSGSGINSGSGELTTTQPRTKRPTTDINNYVEVRTTQRPTFETSTMGNKIPGADNTNVNNYDQNGSANDPQGTNDVRVPIVDRSRGGNSACSLTGSCVSCVFLLTIFLSLFLPK